MPLDTCQNLFLLNIFRFSYLISLELGFFIIINFFKFLFQGILSECQINLIHISQDVFPGRNPGLNCLPRLPSDGKCHPPLTDRVLASQNTLVPMCSQVFEPRHEISCDFLISNNVIILQV